MLLAASPTSICKFRRFAPEAEALQSQTRDPKGDWMMNKRAIALLLSAAMLFGTAAALAQETTSVSYTHLTLPTICSV